MMSLVPEFESFGKVGADPHADPEGANAAVSSVLKSTASDAPDIEMPPDTSVRLDHGILRGGIWHRDAQVRELTGDDEEALARAGTSWYKIIDTLITRGVVSVGDCPMDRRVAGELLIGDRETLLLAIRRCTFGNELVFEKLPCGSCGQFTDLTLYLHDLPTVALEDPERTEFDVALRHGATAYVRLPNGHDQMAVAGMKDANLAQQNSEMISRCLIRIVHADGRKTSGPQLARSLPLADRRTLLEFFAKTQPGPRFADVTWTHEVCGEENMLPIDLGHLFRGI